MLERLDQVGPRIRDILEFIDENERIGALIAACLDEAHRVADHGIEIDPFGLVEFSRVGLRNQPDGPREVLCTGLVMQGFGSLEQHLEGELTSPRSEEHTSELQSLMRISYAVFCLKTKKNKQDLNHHTNH